MNRDSAGAVTESEGTGVTETVGRTDLPQTISEEPWAPRVDGGWGWGDSRGVTGRTTVARGRGNGE